LASARFLDKQVPLSQTADFRTLILGEAAIQRLCCDN